MENNSRENIVYIKKYFIHLIIYFFGLFVLTVFNNLIPTSFSWLSIISYLWGALVILHGIIVFALLGFLGLRIQTRLQIFLDLLEAKYRNKR